MIEAHNHKTTDKNGKEKQLDFEAKQNLLGFFSLLLQVDRRNNPERYKENNDNKNQNEISNQNQQ